jgi:hypothetical protein
MHNYPLKRPQGSFASLDGVMDLASEALVKELVDALGAQLVAAIADVTETRRVRAWERGESPQRLESLRTALQATRAIVETCGPATARAWFTGCSSGLDFISPLEVLRENTQDSRTRVLRAAVTFARH